MIAGIVFVCDVCLEELVISQDFFDPINISEMVGNAPQAKGWYIPDLVGHNEELGKWFEIPSSNIRSLCPKHAQTII